MKLTFNIVYYLKKMNQKELIIALAQTNMPNKVLKAEMFKFHNSMVGKSKYMRKIENPEKSCGSCIQRVLKNVISWYHYDGSAPSYNEIEFTGKLGLHNKPIYKLK